MKLKQFVVAATLVSFSATCNAKSTLTTSGDVLMIAIPSTSFFIATAKKDREGQKEFIKNMAVNIALTHALKFSLRHTKLDKRPNGKHHSFPSGHSSSAFGGAFFLHHRYGLKYSLPAILLSSFVGYSRVKAKAHHWRDVIGGAALSYGVSHFTVKKFKETDVYVDANFNKKQFLVGFNIR